MRTFCTVSRRPAGPLAPPTRRARLRSRWRSRSGGANAGRLARKDETSGRSTYSKFHLCRRGVPAPAAGIVRGRSEPVKAVCDRRTTASVELPGERTREDGLDRTCPDLELAAIGSRDTSGQGPDSPYGWPQVGGASCFRSPCGNPVCTGLRRRPGYPAVVQALVNGQDEYTAAYGSVSGQTDQTSGTLNISFTDSPQAPGAVSVRAAGVARDRVTPLRIVQPYRLVLYPDPPAWP